jgi:CO/xanthine dehydrogenase Mo-binding subunit
MNQKAPFKVVGKSIPRVDGLEKATGRARFAADISLPGTLTGKVLRSPYAHARIVRIDTSAAKAIPGVYTVITGEDTPKIPWGFFVADQWPLSVGKVRYIGEEVAAVAARDEETAERAIRAIVVEYEELPAVFDPDDAMLEGAPQIHEAANNVATHFRVERQDVEKALAGADVVVDETFQSVLQWQCAMEPIASIADYRSNGNLVIWSNVSGIFRARIQIARAMAMDVGQIRIIQSAVGGGFGGKSMDDNNAVITALLAKAARRPVRLVNTREEDFIAGRPRPMLRIRVRMGFKLDGTMVGKDIRVVADNGAYSGKAPAAAGVAALRHDTLYLNDCVRSELFVVYTNKVPTGAFRGFGNPSAEWAVEQAFDIGCERLGLDPREVALKNAAVPGRVSPHGNRIGSCELRACIERATDMVGWTEKRAKRKPFRGLGLALSAHVSGKRHFYDYDGSSVVMQINSDGRIVILCGEGEVGQGNTTILSQIAAEELGVPIETISFSEADTETTPFVLGAFASRLAYVAGNAVRLAAEAAKKELLTSAAEFMEMAVDELEIVEGRVQSKYGQQRSNMSMTIGEVASRRNFRRHGKPIIVTGTWDADSESHGKDRYGSESGAFSFCAHALEVEVDPETGKVSILDYAMATDCGTVIHPALAAGQIEGGLIQGIGYALTEGMMIEDGQLQNPNFSDYKIPCIKDIPPQRNEFVPSYEPTGPFGAKGAGEISMDPVAAAIGNAVADAIGERIHTLPITPEKVLAAIDRARAAGRHP